MNGESLEFVKGIEGWIRSIYLAAMLLLNVCCLTHLYVRKYYCAGSAAIIAALFASLQTIIEIATRQKVNPRKKELLTIKFYFT